MRENQRGVSLGKILGVPVWLDLSWFLIFAILTWSYATNYYPARFAWSSTLYWVMGAVTALALFVSVLLHEFGHALVARGFKIPVRGIRLMIFGGVAELGDESPGALAEFSVAIAGPLVSVLLAVVSGAAWLAAGFINVLEPVTGLLGYLAWINLSLVVFNLIPGFPLDGGRVLRAIVWAVTGSVQRATTIAGNIGRLVAFGFIGLGVYFGLTGQLSSGLWMGFIGMFLNRAAVSEMRAQSLRAALSGRTVGQVMVEHVAALPGDLTIQQLADSRILGSGKRAFVIVDSDRPVGILTGDNIRRVPISEWSYVTLSMAMSPVVGYDPLSPETDLWAAMKQMELEDIASLPVLQDGALVGLVRRVDLRRLVQTITSFGPQMARL